MKRLLSAMLALCMLLSVLCAAPITAKAGGGAAYVCSQVEMDFLLPAIGSAKTTVPGHDTWAFDITVSGPVECVANDIVKVGENWGDDLNLENDEATPMEDGERFRAGQVYRADILLRCYTSEDLSYFFNADTSVKGNGEILLKELCDDIAQLRCYYYFSLIPVSVPTVDMDLLLPAIGTPKGTVPGKPDWVFDLALAGDAVCVSNDIVKVGENWGDDLSLENDEATAIADGELFRRNQTYRADIVLRVDESKGAAVFTENTVVKGNGEVLLKTIHDDGRELRCYYYFQLMGTPIESVSVTGIDFPVAGQPFDYEPDPLPADAPFTLAAPAHWDERINGIEWFDITANRKIDPKTDVALSGHAYSLTVFLTAKPGSCFATDDAGYPCISATLSDTAVTDVGYPYGEDPETYNCLIKYLSVAGEHLIEVKNGTAYNDLGDNIMLEIGAAAPGTVVTLVAKEKPGMGFYGWYCSNEDVEFADSEAITTTFVMPDSDVSVFAEFDEATPVTFISVMELDEPVPFGKPDYTVSIVSDGVAFYGDDRIDGCLNGITWYDHDLGETLDPETDTFIPGHSYTAIVHMKTQTGYYFPVNDEGWYDGIIACINEQEISYSMADETTTHREINLLYDFTVPMAYTLDIIGGTAYRYSEAVTWAEEGDGITIEADKRADAFFIRWEVVSGDAEIIDPNSPMTRFIMPGGDVQIKAVFQSKYLDQVVINQTVEHQTGNILYWDAVEEATAYVICRKQLLIWEEIATTGGLGYKDTTAEPGVRYSYQVYATDGTRTGPKSDAVSMTRPKPPAITHLDNVTITKVIGHTTGNILYWDAVKNADLYQIYRLYSGEGTWTLLKNTRSLGFKDESAKVGVKAYYKIVARNGNVMSDIKSTFSVGVVRPGVPRLDNVVIVKTLGHSTGNIIYWNAVEGAKIYQVYRMRYGDAGWTLLKNTGSLAYKDTDAQSGVKYYYKIVARNGDVKSDIKTTASASVTRP